MSTDEDAGPSTPVPNEQSYAAGGRIPTLGMRRVHHYNRTQVLMPNGTTMCQYTPVFEENP